MDSKVFIVGIFFVLLLGLVGFVESNDIVESNGTGENNSTVQNNGTGENNGTVVNNNSKQADKDKKCSYQNLPRWFDWRTELAKRNKPRERLTKDPLRTAAVVIGAILIILANALLCHLLLWDETFWAQRTYRMLFSLACNDCITGIFLVVGVMTEIESVQAYIHQIGCKIVIAGLWLCVVTSIYTFTVISVARWLMLNHPRFYSKHFQEKPIWTSYIGIASCWIAGAAHAIPLLTNWNDECVTDFSTCSLPYKSSVWIWSTGLTVFFIPSLIIVVVYSLILWNVKTMHQEHSLENRVTKTMSILTAAFLLVWWPVCIYLSVRWNTVGGTRGFYAGAISCLANPVLLISLNSKLKKKVVVMFQRLTCREK